ncbi:uncharacterized protein CANTADRAFT_90611 [Suhomyces tanzawaensis NRRL Y-17324]|uniref:HECT-type E3 ubiquitin transferase n=1 Tax=Suhomyces tanzawaensis NRRL Y-17324 TaxID=984487 RepID=A0A1E4SFR0_9ASCO|nr:uncharacterized protein CANTADRAFT_90611 [Suhomyces tanzawaensis NRRL Y-17324]ODV78242.1 hypothetical protein CANTADRAFT_90611 [Suhomyces tanzawaensis NRRL Y-17324]
MYDIDERESNVNYDRTLEDKHNNNQGKEREEAQDNVDDQYDEEEDTLLRLSGLAHRRRSSAFNPYDDDEYEDEDEEEERGFVSEIHEPNNGVDVDEEEDDDEDFNEEGNLDFLRRFVNPRRNDEEDEYNNANDIDDGDDQEDDDDSVDGDPRAEFLRAIGVLSSAGRGGAASGQGNFRVQGFDDVVQRLMGSGVIFGAGFGSGVDNTNNEMQGLINNLNQREDTYIILETLNELSERLLMMNGITAERFIPANKLAKSLIDIMEDPQLAEELELHLVACRCLYNFLEVNQDFIHEALNNNAIVALCNKLLEITYIDLTEQALQTLEMISRDPISHNQIIASNGLKACLQYLDFLTIHAQRKCLTIVSNSCTNVLTLNFKMVQDVFENIESVVTSHSDHLVVENAWLAISRIIISFKLKPELLDQLFENKISLLKELTQVIYRSCNKSQNLSTDSELSKIALNYSSLLSLLKSLVVLTSVSVNVSKTLLSECRIGDTIVKSLNKYSKNKSISNQKPLQTIASHNVHENISIVALMATPKELLSQFLILIAYLLPISYSPEDTPFLKNDYEEFREKEIVNQNRQELCEEIADSYWSFVTDIWPLLINSFLATMDFDMRKKVFISIFRIVSFNPDTKFSKIEGVSLITGLLASVANQSKAVITKDFPLRNENFEKEIDDDIDMLNTEEGDQNELGKEVSGLNRFGHDLTNKPRSESQFVPNHEHSLEGEAASETEGRASTYRSLVKPQLTTKLQGFILLLSALLVARNLIQADPTLFIQDFEKEGFINDTLVMLNCLDGEISLEGQNHRRESLPKISASYTNKYVDPELTDEYAFQLTENKILWDVAKSAKEVKYLYDSSKALGQSTETSEHMRILTEINETLLDNDRLRTMSFDQWFMLWNKLRKVISETTNGIQLSSFELLSSKIIETLSFIFASENHNYGFEFGDCYKAFISVFFIENEKTSSVLFLIKKLQEALTRSESFEIISSGGSGSSTGLEDSSKFGHVQTAIMAKQVKLKLVAEEEILSSVPKNLQDMVLSVHAIATFKSVDTFLKQRLRFFEDIQGLAEGDRSTDDDTEESGKPGGGIEFSINGEVIPNETTIYGAVYRSMQSKIDEIIDPNKIWSAVHSITFRKVSSILSSESKFTNNNLNSVESEFDIYDHTTLSILKLLKVLFEMNNFVKHNISNGNLVEDSNFMNWKMTVKLNRQLEEPLVVASGTLPGWCIHTTKNFPFIFPLETRMFFLQSTSFGYSRLIHHWQIRTNQASEDNGNSSNGQRPQLGRPTRHKVRLSRKMILQSAVKVLGLYGSTPGILEIEYFDEVGSGLGPTLEFYSTVSKEFVRKKLKLWRDDDLGNMDEEAFIWNEHGLFPAPLDKHQVNSENGRKVLYFFSSLGKFIARALLDSRIIDFNFSTVFLKLVQYFNYNEKPGNRDLKKLANIPSLKLVDPKLASSIEHLLKYLKQYPRFGAVERDSIEIEGATLKDLSIFFELPGYPEYELIPNGSEIQVDAANLENYINKVLEATLYTGIVQQTKAFMDGFSKVFPISSLVLFSPQELVELFGNAEEDWSLDTLTSAINANHGFTKDSDAIKSLINILVSFTNEEKRLFLQFLTGAPKLPIGGFKALRPELTVVRKRAEDNLQDDDYLPSVMTCANYLKLPNYSSEDIMREKLIQAIHEGAGAFLLS